MYIRKYLGEKGSEKERERRREKENKIERESGGYKDEIKNFQL